MGAEPGRYTYGEVTSIGARRIACAMGIDTIEEAPAVNFVDLGSGVGKLVAQAFLEWPAVHSAVGIELSASRSEKARAAWGSLAAAGEVRSLRAAALATLARGPSSDGPAVGSPSDHSDKVEFLEGDLLEFDISEATHVYASSLCFGEDLMRSLAARLGSGAGRTVRATATLRPFPVMPAGFVKAPSVWAEMTWGGPEGQQVHMYLREREVG